MNDYKYRGWFWLGVGALTLVGAIVHLAAGRPVYSDIVFILICGAGFVFHRRLGREDWEERYGVFDERETDIRGRAARLTLKIMGVLLYGAYRLIADQAVSGTLLAVVALGAGVYYLCQAVYDHKM